MIKLGVLLIAVAAIAPVSSPVSSFAQAIQVNKDNRTIAITSTDTAEAVADQAVISVGYLDYGTDEASAYEAGSRRSNAIIAALEKAGVPSDNIESQDQQMEPLNEFEIKNLKAEQKNFRYRISQSWTVKTTPEKASKVLDTAVKAGANQSGNIGWQMKDPDLLEAKAAEKAIAHAQRIASQMAEGLHIHLGPLVYASNQVQEMARPMSLIAMAPGMVAKANMAPLAIRSRKVSQSATVYAVFAVE